MSKDFKNIFNKQNVYKKNKSNIFMVTRIELQSRIDSDSSNINSKRFQIRGAKNKINFKGVRIKDQFSVGRLGIKNFRATGKSERSKGFTDLGVLSNELVGLRSSLVSAEKDLFDFDNGVVVL